MVGALQTLVARRIDPIDSAVLSICQFHAGTAHNVIPETATLAGTVRTLKPHVQDAMERLMGEVVGQIAAALGAEATLTTSAAIRRWSTTPTRPSAPPPPPPACWAKAKSMRERPPGMGGEDFSFMALRVPGCFVRIGQAGPERGRVSVHHPRYDFNDDILPIGASFWAALVEQELPRG